ncbi:coiled-coil-helix-coiled-coil-helix domain-containing protein 7 [Cephus cinctus]|uniref:Coiled-coil-helix-coiled-coil-helix domain-containing protein 7 n=1 Tax=Cephus cinctus TaxID=211228 RepID=A0AAJ7C5C6_CEPCN|nr:coiled-coil-helix-coiled-coil-helix domain-containing protein 7 [Cephus cinctus]
MSTVEDRERLREGKRRTSKMVSKHNSEETNPCFKEAQLSSQCLMENNCDREICSPYFANYKACKKFWNDVMSARRQKGITPYLPPIEERSQVVDDYFKSKAQLK